MGSRISETILGFNNYINDTTAYLADGTPTTNGIRLGLTTIQVAAWTEKHTVWHDTLYPKYSNPLTSTSSVKTQVKNFMGSFKTLAQPMLNIMAASPNATVDDEEMFNFISKRKKPSKPTTPITEQCFCTARALGGSELKLGFRTATDTKRPSLAKEADSVQISYQFIDFTNNPSPGPGEPDPAPTPNDKEMTKEFYTKSQFILTCGMENIGRRVLLFSRWYNTKHPELAGPWSPFLVVLIG